MVGATKWCVFRPTRPTREVVEAAVRERLDRMQSATVDLLQVRLSSVPTLASLAFDELNDGVSSTGRTTLTKATYKL